MQVQVNTDDHIHGGDSLARWITDECKSRLSRFQDHVTRLEVFLTDLDAGTTGGQPWEPKNYDGKYNEPMTSAAASRRASPAASL